MGLWTDVIEPYELTQVARATLEEKERANTLATILPNKFVDDIVVRLTATDSGLLEAAEYRAYDAETSIGSAPAGKRLTVELPPLGQKVRVSEYDQLRLRAGNVSDEQVKNTIAGAAVAVAKAVADRVELARGFALAQGELLIGENQIVVEYPYGRDESMKVTAANKWQDSDAATPIADLTAWVDAYVAKNGVEPDTLILSRKARANLLKSKEVRSFAGASVPAAVTVEFLNNLLESLDLPAVTTYDRKVKYHQKLTPVIPEDKVIITSAQAGVGATFWGTPLEATEEGYDLAGEERPGIAVGAYKDDDPLGVWVRASAIALPVLADGNLAMVAEV